MLTTCIDSILNKTSFQNYEIVCINNNSTEQKTFDAIRLLARTEGLIADPVYEGNALRGLQELVANGRIESDSKVLLMHLGGTPAVHAYANQFGAPRFLDYAGDQPSD